jgi:hypothetical protein
MVTLTNVGASYDAIVASQGLAVGLINFTGVTQAVFLVRVNKIGTGTQSWQLWNDTDGTQIGVIDDAGASGVKNLQATVSVSLIGIKRVRVRVKSTVAADDPIFYDADVLPVTA